MCVALLYLSSRCLVTFSVLWLFLTVPWIGLLCMIVVFPYHTHLLFCHSLDRCYDKFAFMELCDAFASRIGISNKTKLVKYIGTETTK